MSKKEVGKRYLLLVVSICFIAIGIAFAKHSNLGISPISSVANVLSLRFDFFSVGTWLMLWNSLLVVAQVVILRRNFKPIQLLQFAIAFLLGWFTDGAMLFVSLIPADAYPMRLLLVLIGMIILSFGITLTVISGIVMNVGEAMVDVIAKVLHKSFGNVKVVFDICCVALSVLLSLLLFDGTIVGTREGTLITACCTGFVVKWYTKWLKPPIERFLTGKK